jgi:hypothetical protein
MPKDAFQNPTQSDAGTTESEAQGVHIVNTPLFCFAAAHGTR